MTEHHPALSPQEQPVGRQKLVTRYKSFAVLESDEPLLLKLPENQREILRAKGSYDELAKQFNLPTGTVRSRLHRARAALSGLRAAAKSDAAPEHDKAH